MTSEAAALTEQIAGLLAEHAFGFSSKTNVVYCLGCEWSEGMGIKTAIEVHRPHLASVLAARLADSRPVVSEAAIEAAAEAIWRTDHPTDERRFDQVDLTEIEALCAYARAALTDALPHMCDGKGEA